MDPEHRIKGVEIHLEGFTMEELKDIIGYMRSVEAHRESRKIIVAMDVPDDSMGESFRRILELWPDVEGPSFLLAHKEKDRHGYTQ